MFAAVNNLATIYKGQGLAASPGAAEKGTGEFVAVDVATGKVKWDVKLPSSPYGAATIANDVVFTTTFDGTLHGSMRAAAPKSRRSSLRGPTRRWASPATRS